MLDAAIPLPDGQFLVPGNRWDLLDGVHPARTPTVSVIVPYHDGQGQLDRLLGALGAQTHPADHLQVIVADDGSPTAPTIRAAAGLSVEVVTQERRGFRAAAARNLGAARAHGDVLCFLDQDTWPEPDYIRALTRLPALLPDALVTGRRRHADLHGQDVEEVTAWIGGRVRDDRAVLAEPRWLIEQHEASGNLLRLEPESHKYVISAVMACSRRLYADVGGFSPDFVRYGGEDWEFAHRALCAGAVLAHVPEAVAWHDGPSWADRGTAESRRQQRNDETAFVTGMVPPPHGRADVWTGRTNVVVEIGTDGEDSAAVTVAVRSVLGADVDLAVWLRGTAARSIVDERFAFDPRVNAGPPHAISLAGARVHAYCSRPLRFAPDAWPALVDRLGPYGRDFGPGQLVVDTGDGTVTVSTTAALNRSARWSLQAGSSDLLADLFGREVIDPVRSGVTAVPRAPDLAHELKHLRDR